jgi:hypothetical protein
MESVGHHHLEVLGQLEEENPTSCAPVGLVGQCGYISGLGRRRWHYLSERNQPRKLPTPVLRCFRKHVKAAVILKELSTKPIDGQRPRKYHQSMSADVGIEMNNDNINC